MGLYDDWVLNKPPLFKNLRPSTPDVIRQWHAESPDIPADYIEFLNLWLGILDNNFMVYGGPTHPSCV